MAARDALAPVAPGVTRLGFVGLGIMGRPMAANLLAAGYEVTVFNRSPGPAEELAANGARPVASAADVARSSEIVITMLPDTPDVESVIFGPAGIVEGLAAGGVVIDMSTISPSATERFAARLAERGIEMLDAPVSGGEAGAVAGTLAIMVGGREEVFMRCRPVFETLGAGVACMGSHGAGQRTKLVNQAIVGVHLVAMAEGLAFAREAGLEPERVLEIVSRGAAGSWMLTNLAPKALAGDMAPGFTIHLQRKDLELVREEVSRLSVELPGAELALRRFREAEEMGLGELGTQAVSRVYGG